MIAVMMIVIEMNPVIAMIIIEMVVIKTIAVVDDDNGGDN